jgi:hypothetical protein
MNQEDFWQIESGQRQHHEMLRHQSKMNRLAEAEEMNLFLLLKPTLYQDGNQWCVNFQNLIYGFGKTPRKAIQDFNKSFNTPISTETDEGQKIKSLFLMYFDGSYVTDPEPDTSDTFEMGICKLEYTENTLTVHLRRPELLIGPKRKTIDALTKYLGCKVNIVEVDLLH